MGSIVSAIENTAVSVLENVLAAPAWVAANRWPVPFLDLAFHHRTQVPIAKSLRLTEREEGVRDGSVLSCAEILECEETR